jgi:Flp pilus assembly protein TadD
MKDERWLDAIELLKSSQDLVEQNWQLSWNLGWCYFRLARLDKAQKHLTQATELAPGSATCKWALGMVYLEKKWYKKAEAVLLESLRMKETHSARIGLALAYLAQGKVAEAENTHLEGIRQKPRRSEKYESYAAFLSDVGREEEAEKMNRKAEEQRRIH